MDENNRNFLLGILLSIGVLFAWQYFFVPQHPPATKAPTEQSQQQQQQQQQAEPGPPRPGAQSETPSAGGPTPPGAGTSTTLTREEALAQSPRIAIDTPALKGSIALKGGRIDDLTLKDYRETVEPDSPKVILLSPAGGPHAYYAEHGFVGGDNAKDFSLPGADTVWKATSQAPLTQSSPVTLTYDNGKGLTFTRTIAVDDKYMFTVTDKVANSGSEPVTLYPYALVSRHETPQVKGYYILHEGLIGVVDDGLQEITYKKAIDKPPATFKSNEGWLGITDKYWAAVVIPEQGNAFEARLSGSQSDGRDRFQADYLMAPLTVEAGGTAEAKGQVFAGAKEVNLVDTYAERYAIPKFDLLIDWGWFYFLTKPMFFALARFLFRDQPDVFRPLLFLQARRQFRRGHPHRHALHQDSALPSCQQVLRVDEQDEEARARDAAHQRTLRRRSHAPAAGDDGAVQEGEGEPRLRMPADSRPDSRVLRALQGAVRHHRDATRAVLRLDQGFVGAGPDQRVQSVRAASLRSVAGSRDRPFPDDRRVAPHHGLHHVGADEAEPGTAGSCPAEDVRLDAGVLHLPACGLPGRARDLLGVEQPALGDQTVGDHSAAGG